MQSTRCPPPRSLVLQEILGHLELIGRSLKRPDSGGEARSRYPFSGCPGRCSHPKNRCAVGVGSGSVPSCINPALRTCPPLRRQVPYAQGHQVRLVSASDSRCSGRFGSQLASSPTHHRMSSLAFHPFSCRADLWVSYYTMTPDCCHDDVAIAPQTTASGGEVLLVPLPEGFHPPFSRNRG